MGDQFDQRPRIGAFVVSLESHDAGRPIERPIRMLRVPDEIIFVLLAARRIAGGEMHE